MKASGPGQSALLLLDLVEALDRRGFRYAVVGAMAAAFHGVVRASRDADLVVAAREKDLGQLGEELREAGLRTRINRGDPDDPIAAVLTAEDRFKNRVDLIVGIRGMDRGAFDRTVASRFQGEKLDVIGAEDFIAMKASAGSAKDLEDARGVLELSKGKLDLPLVRKLARRFGRQAERRLIALLGIKETGNTKK